MLNKNCIEPALTMNYRLLLLPFLLLLWGCSKPADFEYKITGMQLHSSDNSGSSPVDNSNVAAKAFAIRLEYTLHITGSLSGTDTYESGYRLQNPVTGMNVYSLSNFDLSHPALSSLNDYFLYGSRSTAVNGNSTISRVMGLQAASGLPQASKVDLNTSWTSSDYLVLMYPPDWTGDRDFVVELGLSDHTQLRDTVHVNLYP